MAYDRAALITAVLQELVRLDAGGTASAEDVAAIDARVDPVVQSLTSRGVATLPDVGDLGPTNGDIDPALFNALVVCVADVCGPMFSRPRSIGAVQFAEQQMLDVTRANKSARRLLVCDPAILPQRWPH